LAVFTMVLVAALFVAMCISLQRLSPTLWRASHGGVGD